MNPQPADRLALRVARRRLGMGLARLAKEVGVSPSYLSKLERGGLVPSPWVVEAWERAVGSKWPHVNGSAPVEVHRDPAQLALGLEGSDDESHWVEALLPIETLLDAGPPAVFEWDLPQTIGELAYLTHNYYRYYGKFPPSIPRKLLRDFRPREGTWVLDPYSGSGTTLVEALCEGVPSLGVDISPLATLAGTVKTTVVDRAAVASALKGLLADADVAEPLIPEKASQWFTDTATQDLGRLKAALLPLPAGPVRSFLVLAFFAIIRRVSRAHDGEVRPHINESKRERDVRSAYVKKVGDMLDRMDDLQVEATEGTEAVAITGDSRTVNSLSEVNSHPIGMVISHPPYLNCFDYVPVYKLEYHWAEKFTEVGPDFDYTVLRKSETRAWPATDERIFGKYFEDLDATYRAVGDLLQPGDHCAVVLGDCKVGGRVVPVLDRFTEQMAAAGFDLTRLYLRSTHYGIGKYAYADRADYHGKEAEKRDGVLLFTKR
jgi:transcriptional regulator with XRE-family HTH domain